MASPTRWLYSAARRARICKALEFTGEAGEVDHAGEVHLAGRCYSAAVCTTLGAAGVWLTKCSRRSDSIQAWLAIQFDPIRSRRGWLLPRLLAFLVASAEE